MRHLMKPPRTAAPAPPHRSSTRPQAQAACSANQTHDSRRRHPSSSCSVPRPGSVGAQSTRCTRAAKGASQKRAVYGVANPPAAGQQPRLAVGRPRATSREGDGPRHRQAPEGPVAVHEHGARATGIPRTLVATRPLPHRPCSGTPGGRNLETADTSARSRDRPPPPRKASARPPAGATNPQDTLARSRHGARFRHRLARPVSWTGAGD